MSLLNLMHDYATVVSKYNKSQNESKDGEEDEPEKTYKNELNTILNKMPNKVQWPPTSSGIKNWTLLSNCAIVLAQDGQQDKNPLAFQLICKKFDNGIIDESLENLNNLLKNKVAGKKFSCSAETIVNAIKIVRRFAESLKIECLNGAYPDRIASSHFKTICEVIEYKNYIDALNNQNRAAQIDFLKNHPFSVMLPKQSWIYNSAHFSINNSDYHYLAKGKKHVQHWSLLTDAAIASVALEDKEPIRTVLTNSYCRNNITLIETIKDSFANFDFLFSYGAGQRYEYTRYSDSEDSEDSRRNTVEEHEGGFRHPYSGLLKHDAIQQAANNLCDYLKVFLPHFGYKKYMSNKLKKYLDYCLQQRILHASLTLGALIDHYKNLSKNLSSEDNSCHSIKRTIIYHLQKMAVTSLRKLKDTIDNKNEEKEDCSEEVNELTEWVIKFINCGLFDEKHPKMGVPVDFFKDFYNDFKKYGAKKSSEKGFSANSEGLSFFRKAVSKLTFSQPATTPADSQTALLQGKRNTQH